MANHVSSETQNSLYFISTQIQARHEDQEHKDNKVTLLKKFKNVMGSPEFKAPKLVKPCKPKRKPSKKGARQIKSISAFVKETLGGKKFTDPQSLLDHFLGDQKSLDDFLDEMEVATATPHLLSRRSRGFNSELFTEQEWKVFSEKLRLKFPNLSRQNRKTLKVISKRLKNIKQSEAEIYISQDSNGVWSQASRQPSNDLSTEDLKWLYDLEDEQLQSDTSQYHEDAEAGSPLCLTLSQAVDDRSQRDGHDIHSLSQDEENETRQIESDPSPESETKNEMPYYIHTVNESLQRSRECHLDVIEDSEPEILPLSQNECEQILALDESKNKKINSTLLFGQKQSSQLPWNPGTLSATTSLVFASNTTKTRGERSPDSVTSPIRMSPEPANLENMTVLSTPTQKMVRSKATFDTPSCLRIDSSPLTCQQRVDSSQYSLHNRYSDYKTCSQRSNGTDGQDLFLSANASFHQGDTGSLFNQSDSESIEFSPLKRKQKVLQTHRIEISGKIQLDLSRSSRVPLTVIPHDRPSTEVVVPDSEDEPDEITFVEITEDDNRHNLAKRTSVLQVPSSPDFS